MHSYTQRIGLFLLSIIPAAIMLLLIGLSGVSWHMPLVGSITSKLVFICIYFWRTFYPSVAGNASLFVLGIIQDAVAGTPIGFSSAHYLLFSLAMPFQQKIMGRTLFRSLWLGFICLSLLSECVMWGVILWLKGSTPDIYDMLLPWAMAVFIFPPAYLLLTKLYRIISPS